MGIGLIIMILALGLLCLFAEFFLFPGFSIAGIAGAIILVAAVYLAYGESEGFGHIMLASAVILSAATFWVGANRISKSKFAIDSEIDSKVNVIDLERISVGDMGKAVSALRPGGTALINGDRFEVFTNGDFVDSEEELQVVKITDNKIFVKSISQT